MAPYQPGPEDADKPVYLLAGVVAGIEDIAAGRTADGNDLDDALFL